MRSVFVSALGLLLAGSAFASFDLFLVPNATNNYTRFDPVNRVALGNIFVDGSRYASAVSARQSGLFSYTSGMQSINWSTGERLGFPFGLSTPIELNETGTRFLRISGTSTVLGNFTVSNELVNTTVGATSFATTAGVNLGPDRWVLYGYTASGLQLQVINDAGQTVSAISNPVAVGAMLPNSLGQATIVRRGSSRFLVVPYRDATGFHRLSTVTISGNGTTFSNFFTQPVSNFSIANAGTTLSAVRGHTGFFLVGADSASPTTTRITEFDDQPSYSAVTSYTTNAITPIVTQRWQMANIVAPEPGTMIALGAGLVAILRRRKKA